jgi:hypothetical protein
MVADASRGRPRAKTEDVGAPQVELAEVERDFGGVRAVQNVSLTIGKGEFFSLPVTADDVVFSLNRLIALGQGNASLSRGWVKQVDALDRATVRFTLTASYAPFLANTLRLAFSTRRR